MSQPRVERRMAAILAADVAGYSRLMGIDEEGTLARLKAHRRELVDGKIREHRGHIVKTTGDGMLVEFVSPVEAVRCAVKVQRCMADRNANTPHERRIAFRMGINLGDVIADGGDLFGDGVTWRRGSRMYRSRVACAYRARYTTRYAISSLIGSRMRASTRSRT
jgi:adenylate cyclase